MDIILRQSPKPNRAKKEEEMIKYKKAIAGNRYEVIIRNFQAWLLDKTLNQVIASSDNEDELIIYAQKENMINADAVIIR
jgi:hypothetical protein